MPNPNMRFARDGQVGGCVSCYFTGCLYLIVAAAVLAMILFAVLLFGHVFKVAAKVAPGKDFDARRAILGNECPSAATLPRLLPAGDPTVAPFR